MNYASTIDVDGVVKILGTSFLLPGFEYIVMQPKDTVHRMINVDSVKIREPLWTGFHAALLCSDQGVLKYNGGDQQIRSVTSDDLDCWHLFSDSTDRVTFRSNNYGHYTYSLVDQQLTKLTTFPTNADLRFRSSDGTLWLNEEDYGIHYRRETTNRFRNPVSKTTYSGTVQKIHIDRRGLVYVVVARQPLLVFDAQGDLLHVIDFGKSINFTSMKSSIAEDSDGNVWVENSGELYRIAPDFTYERVHIKDGSCRSVAIKYNELLIATSVGLKYGYTHQNVEAITFNSFKHDPGDIWKVRDNEAGFILLRPDDGYQQLTSVTAVPTKPIRPASIFNDLCRVDSIYYGATNQGLLYGAELEHSLLLNNPFWEHYTQAVCIDGNGQVWFTTLDGLYRFADTETLRYSTSDGLSSDRFQAAALAIHPNGTMWAGTNTGLVVFHPDSLPAPAPAPTVYIDQLSVNNTPYEGDTLIQFKSNLELPAGQNSLAFQLKAVGTYAPAGSTLRYQLEGYNDVPQTVKNGGFARFTRLPPGEYALAVVAVNAQGVTSKKKVLPITIIPPFYQRWWFRMSLGAIVVGLIFVGFQIYYGRQLRAQRRQIERQNLILQERERIAKDLHDDLGGGLSSILFLSEDLASEATHQRKELQRIQHIASDAMLSMRDIIWAYDEASNNLDALVQHLRDRTLKFANTYRLVPKIIVPEQPLHEIEVSGEKRRNIALIVAEALNNIGKHANASKISIAIDVQGQQLIITITDNGMGMLPNDGDSGYGLRNMQIRAEAIGGKLDVNDFEQGGTEIQLITSI